MTSPEVRERAKEAGREQAGLPAPTPNPSQPHGRAGEPQGTRMLALKPPSPSPTPLPPTAALSRSSRCRTHPTEHQTPAQLTTASPHGHAGESSARPRLPPAPSGPWGWPTLVPRDSRPHGRCTRAFPELGASCGEETFSLGCLHGARGGLRALALLWVRLTSFLSSHFHGNQPQPSIH